ALADERTRGRDTIAVDLDRQTGTPRDQQRLVAAVRDLRIGAYADGRGGTATVAAADDARLPAAPRQVLRDRDRQRRLAAATGDEIAYHDHRHRYPLRAPPAPAPRGVAQVQQHAVHGRERTQARPGRDPAEPAPQQPRLQTRPHA